MTKGIQRKGEANLWTNEHHSRVPMDAVGNHHMHNADISF